MYYRMRYTFSWISFRRSLIPINCNFTSIILPYNYYNETDLKYYLEHPNPESEQCESAEPILDDYVHHICINSGQNYYYNFNYQKENKIVLTPNITEAYLYGLKMDKYYSSSFKLTSTIPLFIVNEQAVIVYYSLTINKRMVGNYLYSGLVGGKEEEFVDFNAHTDNITTLTTPNATTLILRPISMDIIYHVEVFNNLSSIISNIGGFFSALSGIFVFLFGTTKLAP
ncbi:hypothetical protein GLOIN_2v1703188 [Rhizophagus clarus]|uniref:Uncharacterized protein n=1 Tax=Rhizophagus clarus TaxID=94130 RepID=A0A8H3M7H7_9GLOM|nr:hypothetical protein GLOIN_2v1703188 [Rhizophagus clarus]